MSLQREAELYEYLNSAYENGIDTYNLQIVSTGGKECMSQSNFVEKIRNNNVIGELF